MVAATLSSGWFLENAWLIPVIPGAAFFVIILFGKRLPMQGSELGIASMGASLVLAVGTAIQWIQRTDRLDYGIAAASTQQAGGRWRTRVEVVRTGEAWMPVVLRVGGETRTLDSRARRQTVEIVTDARPAEAVLDPDWVLIDYDRSNNRAPLP